MRNHDVLLNLLTGDLLNKDHSGYNPGVAATYILKVLRDLNIIESLDEHYVKSIWYDMRTDLLNASICNMNWDEVAQGTSPLRTIIYNKEYDYARGE